MKRTYQPSKKRRKKTHGFRVRMKNSPHLFKRKRQKGRKVITV